MNVIHARFEDASFLHCIVLSFCFISVAMASYKYFTSSMQTITGYTLRVLWGILGI